MKKALIIEVICFLFILLFLYAAVTKILDYDKFRVQIGQSPLLTAFAGWVAVIVPTIEIIIACMLMIPRFRLLALFGAFGLMVVFTAYIVIILNFSDYVPCSCGGILEKLGWTEHLVFNVAFVFVGLIGILLHPSSSSVKAVAA